MFTSLKRLLAVGLAASVAFVGVGAVTAPQAEAAAASHTSRASSWLAGYQFSVDDGYGKRIVAATGLAVLDKKADAATLRTKLAELSAGAAANAVGNAGNATNLAILARIMHLDPTTFGGVDLIDAILDASHLDSSDPALVGQVGDYGSAYAQALAIIALTRSHQPVPDAIVAKLLTFRDATSGAFGYDAGGFVADPDSTALSIQALYLLKGHKTEIAKAVAWASKTRTKAGYWDSWSPVDSTSLMASTMKMLGKPYKKSKAWLDKQQLADGGFAAEKRTPTSTSDLYATYDATFLLSGKTLAKASYHLKGYTKSPRPKITGIAKVGQTLTATTGTWAPAPTTISYQWLRNGKKIDGATASTYLVADADRGYRLRVKVTVSGMGLKTLTEVSARTRTVAA